MRLILDENVPSEVKDEIIKFHDIEEYLDIDEEHDGMLDFKMVEMMSPEDVMVTRDKELHKNLLDIGRKSVYYDIEKENLVELQIKLKYYLEGYDNEEIHTSLEENEHVEGTEKPQLRERLEELKKENAELRSRINVLEGKLESIFKKARTALEDRSE